MTAPAPSPVSPESPKTEDIVFVPSAITRELLIARSAITKKNSKQMDSAQFKAFLQKLTHATLNDCSIDSIVCSNSNNF